MSTPSKSALAAAKEIEENHVFGRMERQRIEERAAIIDRHMATVTLPLADLKALVDLAREQTRYIEETDKSATGSIYGIEYADKTIARVAVQLP